VELTTEEQQLLSGGQSGPDQPPIDDGNRDGNGLKNLTNRLSIANPIPK
jgi:hypothetical protein